MHDEFDIIFVLVLGFFVETIILLVILIRLDQPRDRTEPTADRHGTDQSNPGPPAPSAQPPQGQQPRPEREGDPRRGPAGAVAPGDRGDQVNRRVRVDREEKRRAARSTAGTTSAIPQGPVRTRAVTPNDRPLRAC